MVRLERRALGIGRTRKGDEIGRRHSDKNLTVTLLLGDGFSHDRHDSRRRPAVDDGRTGHTRCASDTRANHGDRLPLAVTAQAIRGTEDNDDRATTEPREPKLVEKPRGIDADVCGDDGRAVSVVERDLADRGYTLVRRRRIDQGSRGG